MSLSVLSSNSVIIGIYSSESRMSEQSHVSERQSIDGLLAKQRQTTLSNLGTMLWELKYIIDVLFELPPNIWPVGLIGLKKTRNLNLDLSGLLHVLLNRSTHHCHRT